MSRISRRKLMGMGIGAAAGVSGLAVADRIARRYGLIPPDQGGLYGPGETLTYAAQRLLTRRSMAREFPRSAISNPPFANGRAPKDPAFLRLQTGGFADWRLQVEGMVAHPASLSLGDLKSLPMRSQITHLQCEEGWSFIAEWIGVPLSYVLEATGILPQARYIVYQPLQPGVWDSVDMADALHPQTLVTYGMNGSELPVGNGGPLRLRVPRQLGYKSVKYLSRLTVTDDITKFGKGRGSAASEHGYAWYAGM